MHDPDPGIAEVERSLRVEYFLRPGTSVDLDAPRTFLARGGYPLGARLCGPGTACLIGI